MCQCKRTAQRFRSPKDKAPTFAVKGFSLEAERYNSIMIQPLDISYKSLGHFPLSLILSLIVLTLVSLRNSSATRSDHPDVHVHTMNQATGVWTGLKPPLLSRVILLIGWRWSGVHPALTASQGVCHENRWLGLNTMMNLAGHANIGVEPISVSAPTPCRYDWIYELQLDCSSVLDCRKRSPG